MIRERGIRRRAGTSAAQEYERLKREWRARNRMMFRWLGVGCGLVIAGTIALGWPHIGSWIGGVAAGCAIAFFILARESPPAWIGQYQTGSFGEERTAKVVAPLLRSGWQITHDLDRQRFNIDHLLIGPGGVFVLETKNLSGVVTVDGDKASLRRPGAQRIDYRGDWWAREARSHAAEANQFFRQRTGARPWVTAAVVLWADFPQGQVEAKNVTFVHGDQLVAWLKEQPVRLSAERIQELTTALQPRHRQTAAKSVTA